MTTVTPSFLSISDVATVLGVSRWTVGRLLENGELPGIRVREVWRIDRADFADWLEAQKAASLQRATERRASVAPAKRPVGRPRKAGLGNKSAAVAAADA